MDKKELKKIEKLLDKRGCIYRLKGWPPGKWDYLGTQNFDIMERFLEATYPGQVETILNKERARLLD